MVRLVADDADAASAEAPEAADDVLGPVRVDLEEDGVVHHEPHQLRHVVGPVGVVGNDVSQRGVPPLRIVAAGDVRRVLRVVLGQEREERADHRDRLGFVLRRQVRHAAAAVVGHRAAEVFLGHLFVGDRADDVGAGDEHIAGPLHHDDEVRDRGRIDGASGAGTHDRRDLGHDPRGEHVAQKDVRVTGERLHALLDARPARVVQADDRGAHLHRVIHDLHDLLGERSRERAAEDGEVLGEDEDQPAIDGAAAGDHAIARDLVLAHAEVLALVDHEAIGLAKGPRVDQQLDALARGELAGLVLALDALGSAPLQRALVQLVELLDFLLDRQG